jgi:hypothetical protein
MALRTQQRKDAVMHRLVRSSASGVLVMAVVLSGACGSSPKSPVASPAISPSTTGPILIQDAARDRVPSSIAEMTSRSTTVLRGTATTTVRHAPIGSLDFIFRTIQVTEVLKGDQALAGKTVEVSQEGPEIDELVPHLQAGAPYVLFLVSSTVPGYEHDQPFSRVFGAFKQSAGGLLTDTDPHSQLSTAEHSIALDKLRLSVTVIG